MSSAANPITGFSPEEAQRLVRAAAIVRPDDPKLAAGPDAAERLRALKQLLLLLEASIGSLNLGLRLYESPGDETINRGLAAEEAIRFLSSWAADSDGAGLSASEAVDAAPGKPGPRYRGSASSAWVTQARGGSIKASTSGSWLLGLALTITALTSSR
jgi:hypothetical protein